MVTRVLEFVSKPGGSAAMCDEIETEVRAFLKSLSGFMELVTLVSEAEPHLVVLLSVWRSRGAAERYEELAPGRIAQMLEPWLDPAPHEPSFEFARNGSSLNGNLSFDDETLPD